MKKSINKLSLNKITISNLHAVEMNRMVGGVVKTASGCSCTTCIPINCQKSKVCTTTIVVK